MVRDSVLLPTSDAAPRAPVHAAATMQLEGSTFDRIFPFHVLVDAELRIRSCGPSLSRLLPTLDERSRLTDLFQVVSPVRVDSFARIVVQLHRRFVLRCRSLPALELRGQFVSINKMRRLAFIASPRVTLSAMTELGFHVEDFAAHDGIGDYLALFEAQRMALADAARLSEDLACLNAELDSRVALRTHELEAANAQLRATSHNLAATLDELREAKKQLECEMAERARVEGEVRIGHRLEAVGQLAAGVAHEINTPIQYVSDSVHFVQDALGDLLPLVRGPLGADIRAAAAWAEIEGDFLVERLPEALGRSLDGLDRVATIVRAMKAFAHPGSVGKAPADLNAALENTLAVSRNEYKYVADIVTEFSELPLVSCNVAELGQVFLNLIVNAGHAIGERVQETAERGTIRVATALVGDQVTISVSDDGAGIPDELTSRIFDPFFTTKPVGKGTGQGLTIARNIVVKHGGTLNFASVVGRGTTFFVTLPLVASERGGDGVNSRR